MQLAAAKNTATTEDDYLAIINAKTAALFSAAAEVGAAIANRPAEEQAALKSYGRNLGIAFQLVDDALDYSGDSAELGKSVGDDFREGKITLPVILWFRRGGERGARVLEAHDRRRRDRGRRPRAGHRLMRKHNAIEATLERARSYGAHRPRCAGDLPGFCREIGHAGRNRLLHRAGPLTGLFSRCQFTPRLIGGTCRRHVFDMTIGATRVRSDHGLTR